MSNIRTLSKISSLATVPPGVALLVGCQLLSRGAGGSPFQAPGDPLTACLPVFSIQLGKKGMRKHCLVIMFFWEGKTNSLTGLLYNNAPLSGRKEKSKPAPVVLCNSCLKRQLCESMESLVNFPQNTNLELLILALLRIEILLFPVTERSQRQEIWHAFGMLSYVEFLHF